MSLADPITSLIAEYDRRVILAEGDEGIELVALSEA